jgi:hypothetical protein
MPGLSGLGVAAALRGIGATGKSPLLAFTAFGTADYIQEMKEVGFDAVCRKPAELTQLEGMIFRLLGHESVDGFQVVLSTAELVPTPSRPRPDRSTVTRCQKERDALDCGSPVTTFPWFTVAERWATPCVRRHGGA